MVVVVGGIIPTRDHDFLLGRGENDGDKESRLCDTLFDHGTCITNATVPSFSNVHNIGLIFVRDKFMSSICHCQNCM